MFVRPVLWSLSLSLLLLAGCTPLPAYTRLAAEEQGLYRVYSRVMSPGQRRAYLALPTAVERAAYARQVGAAQRFEALAAADRAVVLGGRPVVGMSRQALLLLWGEPPIRQGPEQYELWYYYGDEFSLAEPGYHAQLQASIMEVALEGGKVVWWAQRAPRPQTD